jgi:CYTH domain-containing protein
MPRGVTDERVIVDHYWKGTTLRLRMVEDCDGVVYKLCQKVRLDPKNPESVKITNMYLDEAEFRALSVTPASIISKSRWHLVSDGVRYAIDEFKGRHSGLILAETELGEDDPCVSIPGFAVAEVTEDAQYSGGFLAAASNEDLARIIEP